MRGRKAPRVSGRIQALAGALIAGLALGLMPGHAQAAIKVLSQSQNTVASFGSVKCEVKRVQGAKRFTARGEAGGWRLAVVIFPGSFEGFRTYEVLYGSDSSADVSLGPRGQFFSNLNKPPIGGAPGPELTTAGAVGFPNKGHKRRVLGIGIPIIYDRTTSGNWVSLAGRARCKY